MSGEYDGKLVVGIDLHRRRSVLVRMTEAGERLDTVRIDNDPMTLAAEIAKAGEHPQVVLEATYAWHWAVDVLTDAGADVHLAHPLGVKGFAYRRVKNDLLTEPFGITAAQSLDRHRGSGRIGDLRAFAVVGRCIDLESAMTGTGHSA